MKKVNRKRGGHMFPKNVDEGLREYVRAQPCILQGAPVIWHSLCVPHVCIGAVQVCHVRSRGAGGADRNNTYPGCAAAHEEQHAIGLRSFEARWGISLRGVAELVTAQYEAEKFPCP